VPGLKPEAEGRLNSLWVRPRPFQVDGGDTTKFSRRKEILMTASTQKKIALVEDSEDTAELMTLFLSQLCDDLQVCPFPAGPAFLEAFQRGVYWLVILDLSLPEMDGYEVLRRVRLIDPNIPVIAFTAHADRDYRERAMQAGFTDVVTKPVRDMDAFCRMIIRVAEARTS
jgi:CheY-like chemotaxis protein